MTFFKLLFVLALFMSESLFGQNWQFTFALNVTDSRDFTYTSPVAFYTRVVGSGSWVPRTAQTSPAKFYTNASSTVAAQPSPNQEIPVPFPSGSMSFDYSMNGTTVAGTWLCVRPAFVGTMNYGAANNAPNNYLMPSMNFALDAAGVTTPTDNIAAGPHKEILLDLNNLTGVDRQIQWGDKTLTLPPGMSEFRYDGPVDANGLPSVAPSDFQGIPYSTGGQNHLYGSLVPSALDSGEVMWAPPASLPPAPATATRDQIEVIRPATATTGAFIAIHKANGTTILTTLPVTPATTTSNTTGPSAVISDPTSPKPNPTSSNSVTNVIGNTVNNTVQGGTTIITGTGAQAAGVGGLGDTGGKAISTSGTASAGASSGAMASLKALTDNVDSWLPSTALKGKIFSANQSLEGVTGKIKNWHPMGHITSVAGSDFTQISLPARLGGQTVNFPLNHPGIGWFRNCCLFALYFMGIFKILRILQV